jgi:hypothetical protein
MEAPKVFNLIYVATALAMTFAMFHQSMTFNSVNRVYLGLYKGVFESCVVAYDNKGNQLTQPVFAPILLREAVDNYFESNLAPYGIEYDVTTTLTDYKGTVGKVLLPTVAKVTFTAKINDWQNYRRLAVFSIKKV